MAVISREDKIRAKKQFLARKAKMKKEYYKVLKKENMLDHVVASKNDDTIANKDIMKPVRSLYKNPLEAAAERKERERNEKQQELETSRLEQRDKERRRRDAERQRQNERRQLMQKTRKGQPVMANQINHLLRKIQKG